MVLSFTALNKQGQFRSFSCQLQNLELALDVLSSISSQGDTILTAEVVDKGNRTQLPADVFDGELLSESMHQLEAQWQAILNEPVQVVPTEGGWRLEIAHRRLKLYNQRINHYIGLINSLEQLRHQAEATLHTEVRKKKLISHYSTMLNRYYNCLERLEADQYTIQQKLHQFAC